MSEKFTNLQILQKHQNRLYPPPGCLSEIEQKKQKLTYRNWAAGYSHLPMKVTPSYTPTLQRAQFRYVPLRNLSNLQMFLKYLKSWLCLKVKIKVYYIPLKSYPPF